MFESGFLRKPLVTSTVVPITSPNKLLFVVRCPWSARRSTCVTRHGSNRNPPRIRMVV